jgi:YihY family inner membrane protein
MSEAIEERPVTGIAPGEPRPSPEPHDHPRHPSGRGGPVRVGPHLLRFAKRVLSAFIRNRGLLLSGGVGYNMLLSAVPLLAVAAWALTFVYDESILLDAIRRQLHLLAPPHADALADAVAHLLEVRNTVGVLGVAVLLFFSALAFRMLEDAIATIFAGERIHTDRQVWMSALIAFGYVLVSGVALLILTGVTSAAQAIAERGIQVGGTRLELASATRYGLQGLGLAGLAVLFTSMYKVLPPCPVGGLRALAGGVVAALLWAVLSRVLVFYFMQISLVNVIYGSLASVIVVLLGLEALAAIVLLGAQVIACLEASAQAGVRWYETPPASAGERP